MKKILVFSWFYPPNNSSEGLMTFKLLNNSSYEYDVFTQNANDEWAYGNNMTFPNNPNVHVIYSTASTMKAWRDEGYRFFVTHRQDYDCIMTRSMPPESHEIGIRIKIKYPKVKWIASFGDPIKNFPFWHMDGKTAFSHYSVRNKINRQAGIGFYLSPNRVVHNMRWNLSHPKSLLHAERLSVIEDLTLILADRLVFNNKSQMRYMIPGKTIQKKAVIIRHSYDPRFYLGLEKHAKQTEKKQFVYIGELNEIRTARPLLKAIREMINADRSLEERVEFAFYGKMSETDKNYILENGLQQVVKVHGPISYEESLQKAVDADWLIHVDADISIVSDENVFFAGKIADYFGTGTPIVAITMEHGDVADELKNTGMLVTSFQQEEIIWTLNRILYQNTQVSVNKDWLQQYSAPSVAAGLDRMIKTLMEDKMSLE